MQTEKTIARCKEVERRVSEGCLLKDALKETGLSASLLSQYRINKRKTENKKVINKKPHKFVDLILNPKPSKLAVIVCSPDDLSSVLQGLV